MAPSIDLSLPESVPGIKYHQEQCSTSPFALYTLCDSSDEDLAAFEKLCADDANMEEVVSRAPCHRFLNKRLEDIVTYHTDLGREQNYDPVYFIVIADPAWRTKGVVLVTLDDDDLECKPDLLWIPAADAGLTLVNLQISNTDWEETKEGVLYDEAVSNEAEGGEDRGETAEDDDQEFGKAPPMGYHIAVYVREGISPEAVIKEIEPSWSIKRPSEVVCKVLKSGDWTETSEISFVSQAASLHPIQVSKHPTLHATMFLAVENENFVQEGLTLVELDWDAQTKDRSEGDLEKLGMSVKIDTLTVGSSAVQAGDWAAVFLFATIARKGGIQKWKPRHLLIGAHCPPCPDGDVKLVNSLDSGAAKRRFGEEKIMPGGWITAARGYDEYQFCLQLLEAQRSFCLRLRFAPNLCNELFIYSSAAEKRETEEVMVVRVVEGTEKLTKALDGNDMLDVSNMKIEAINCPALGA